MKCTYCICFLFFFQGLYAQSNLSVEPENANPVFTNEIIKREYFTKEIADSPEIDGKLDEEAWKSVEWASGFLVNRPNSGDIPQRQTQFKILYDDNNLYLGVRCFDEEPSKIESRLSRRDNFPGDWIEVNIGSLGDNNTAYSFTSSVSGVRGDEFVTKNGDSWDKNWNPIWYNKAVIDEEGWTTELKIPFSQLRFGNDEIQEWGIQVQRRDFRADERSIWQFIPRNASGWVSNFGTLKGLSGIKPKRQIEIQPYVVGSLETFEAEEGNPFGDGTKTVTSFGLDGKIGITNDITLDFTVNPDFGQVEADPSRLTLDGFQIFFSERRPFFIENSNLFRFQVTPSGGNGAYRSDNLFYSRRVGSRPKGDIDVPDGAYFDAPKFTSIIGSAKLSGKTKKGWSIGILESITAEEIAKMDYNGEQTKLIVEPLSNYFVGRLSKDFNEGASTLGMTLTSVKRDLDGTGLEDQFHSDALTGGVNFLHTWKNREWQIKGNMVFSEVRGTTEKIVNTQESFEHYFQRPDTDHLGVDESVTKLSGSGGNLSIGNFWGMDNMGFESGVTWRSKGLELNDIGFLSTADEINYYFWAGHRIPRAKGIFRSLQVNYNHYSRWTGGGEHLYLAFNSNGNASFNNYWSVNMSVNFEQKDISQKALFGGPLLRRAPGFYKSINVNSDSRKKFTYGFNSGRFDAIGSDKGSVIVQNFNFWLSYQFSDALRISLSPGYFQQDRKIQNVSFEELATGNRYITGNVNQKTLESSFRINYSITPDLSLQYWGQPFSSIGNYNEFKYITDSVNKDFNKRFHLYTNSEISYDAFDEIYYIDEEGSDTPNYSFENPDFNFIEFRSNMVLRWEYKPGSEFFFVWSQSTSNLSDPNKGIFSSITEDLFNEKPQNIFLIKATYRFY